MAMQATFTLAEVSSFLRWTGGVSGEKTMTEQEWQKCSDPQTMLKFLKRRKASDRKFILFSLACADRHAPTIEEYCQKIYGMWDGFVEGLISLHELNVAYEIVLKGLCKKAPRPYDQAVWDASAYLSKAKDKETEVKSQTSTLRDLFGPIAFRRVAITPSILLRHDGTIPRLAQALYEERQMPAATFDPARMNILADALLDAGCDNEEIIQHCRGDKPHVRGCWVVDLMLGKS